MVSGPWPRAHGSRLAAQGAWRAKFSGSWAMSLEPRALMHWSWALSHPYLINWWIVVLSHINAHWSGADGRGRGPKYVDIYIYIYQHHKKCVSFLYQYLSLSIYIYIYIEIYITGCCGQASPGLRIWDPTPADSESKHLEIAIRIYVILNTIMGKSCTWCIYPFLIIKSLCNKHILSLFGELLH